MCSLYVIFVHIVSFLLFVFHISTKKLQFPVAFDEGFERISLLVSTLEPRDFFNIIICKVSKLDNVK